MLSGTEKLEDAPENRCGIADPRVACRKLPTVDVVQPEPAVAEKVAQFAPVNPFVQMHRHELDEITEMPPFEHGVEEAQFARGSGEGGEVEFSLGKTMSTTGMTTAAAIRRNSTRRTRRKPHSGRPQHLLLGCFSSLSSKLTD